MLRPSALSKHLLRIISAAAYIIRWNSTVSAGGVSAPRRFLFLQYESALGSAINATPVYEALKEAFPESFTAVACAGLNFQVLSDNPNIDHIIQTTRSRPFCVTGDMAH